MRSRSLLKKIIKTEFSWWRNTKIKTNKPLEPLNSSWNVELHNDLNVLLSYALNYQQGYKHSSLTSRKSTVAFVTSGELQTLLHISHKKKMKRNLMQIWNTFLIRWNPNIKILDQMGCSMFGVDHHRDCTVRYVVGVWCYVQNVPERWDL